MDWKNFFRINKKMTLSINGPLVSEGIILTNYYEELQKNNWVHLIDDDTKKLTDLIKLQPVRLRQQSK